MKRRRREFMRRLRVALRVMRGRRVLYYWEHDNDRAGTVETRALHA